jgi:hypothetical protein
MPVDKDRYSHSQWSLSFGHTVLPPMEGVRGGLYSVTEICNAFEAPPAQVAGPG